MVRSVSKEAFEKSVNNWESHKKSWKLGGEQLFWHGDLKSTPVALHIKYVPGLYLDGVTSFFCKRVTEGYVLV